MGQRAIGTVSLLAETYGSFLLYKIFLKIFLAFPFCLRYNEYIKKNEG